jgi:dihydroorotate dehydrogenase
VQGFEINVSCPNQCGVTSMQTEQHITQIINTVKQHNETLAVQNQTERKALLIKIAPLTRERNRETKTFNNTENIKDLTPDGLKMIASVCEGNVDGIVATNTAQEHNFTEHTPIITASNTTITGGMSGR